MKLVPRSLGASERFSGFGETFQGLVDARVDENASIGCPMPVSHRESSVSSFWSLQTRFKGDHGIPVGCASEPEPEPASSVDVGLSFFAVDDVDEFPWRRRQAAPRQLASHIRRQGEVSNTGPLGKMYG